MSDSRFRDPKGALFTNNTGQLRTYGAGSGYGITADGSPFQIQAGGGKIIKVRRVTFRFWLTTAAIYGVGLLKNAASLTGTFNLAATVPLDSADTTPAGAVASGWSAGAIPVGGMFIDYRKAFAGDVTHPAELVDFDFNYSGAKPIVLRGAECLQVAIGAGGYAGASMSASALWTEEDA